MLDRAETVQCEMRKTPANGIAHEQSTGQHRRASQHAERHGEVHAPVVAQAAADELVDVHRLRLDQSTVVDREPATEPSREFGAVRDRDQHRVLLTLQFE